MENIANDSGQMSSGTLSRREMLRRVGGGFGTLGLAHVLASSEETALHSAHAAIPNASQGPLSPKPPHFPARAKRVIYLFMNGGPSHVDTFDPKPMLKKYQGQTPEAVKVDTGRRKKGKLMPSPFKSRPFGKSGIEISEIFPHLGECIDDMCIIRSMYGDDPNHEPGLLMMNSGNPQPIRPSIGSWMSYGLGSENQNLPGFIVLCPGKPVVGPQLWSNSFLPGVFQGTHLNNKNLDPKKLIRHLNNRYLSRTAQRRQLDLLQEMNRHHLQQRHQDDQLEAKIASLEIAFRMQFEAQDALDINRESAATRKLYGQGNFAETCLMARRLSERGVRMVQISFGNGQPWDDHSDISNHRKHAFSTDQAIAGLLKDLKSRGLLEETLVIWGGEFGHTPM